MHMLDAKKDLLDEVGGLLLRQPLLLRDEVEELAASQPDGQTNVCATSWPTAAKHHFMD